MKTYYFISIIPLLLLFLRLKNFDIIPIKKESKSVLFLVALSKSFNSFVNFALNFSVLAYSLITCSWELSLYLNSIDLLIISLLK